MTSERVPRRVATLCVLAAGTLPAIGCGGLSAGGALADSAPMSGTASATPVRTPVVSAAAATRTEQIAAMRPPIVQKPIALPAKRRRETVQYAQRHYGIGSSTLEGPHVIVQHFTVTPDVASTYAVFAPDEPDVELHELPGLCSQFIVGRDGTIYQLTPVTFMCRHTVGLNYTAVGIEHVGSSDREILTNAAQLRASLRLTRWLRCRSRIAVKNVIGHSESLSSPYHRENVARLRTQTHGDWTRADMRIYRRKLAALGTCQR